MKSTNNIHTCILAILLLLLTTGQTNAENNVRIVSVSVQAGNECTVEVQVDNNDAFVAFQADIPIPDVFSYVDGSAQLNATRISGHLLSASIVGTNLRLIAFSISNTPFMGNSGTLLSFQLKAGTVPGSYQLPLNNAMLGNSLSQNILTSTLAGTATILGPNIQVSPISIDFGRVALTTSVSQNININNLGNQNLVIDSLDFSNLQFTSPDSNGFTIIPGGNKNVTITFAPSTKGTYSKQMQIIANDPDDSITTVGLQAVGFAVNELHGGNIAGASGDTAKLEFTVNNMEGFVGFQFDLDLPQPMSYLAGSATLFRHQNHLVLANMIDANTLRVLAFSTSSQIFTGTDEKILSIEFLLDGVAGNYGINLYNVIIVNNLEENIVSASSIGFLQITSSDIHSQTNLAFGDVSILDDSTQNLTIFNYGQEPLIVEGLNFSNPVFSSTFSLPDTILPSDQVNLPIRFSKNTKGSANGSLQILSNDPDENPFLVTLTGNAFVPNYLVVVSDTVTQGDSIAISIEVTNNEPFVAFQFDLDFPVGLLPDLNKVELSERKQDHVFSANLIESHRIRIVSWSISQKPFIGETGAVITIPFKAESSMIEGMHPLILTSSMLSNANSENIFSGTKDGFLSVESYSVPRIISLKNKTVKNGESECYGATDTIYVAGGGTTVDLQRGSTVDLIAGKLIRLLPGFHAWQGSYAHAHITTTATFCEKPSSNNVIVDPIVNSMVAISSVLNIENNKGEKSIKLFPNPNNGQFTIELTNFESSAAICVYNMLGEKVCQSTINSSSLEIKLNHIKKGIYFVHVNNGKEQVVKKMIMN